MQVNIEPQSAFILKSIHAASWIWSGTGCYRKFLQMEIGSNSHYQILTSKNLIGVLSKNQRAL